VAKKTASQDDIQTAYRRLTGNDMAQGQWVALDARIFILTGSDVPSDVRRSNNGSGRALPLETSVRGVFAIGDVRSGSVKRVGAAIGEGQSLWQGYIPFSQMAPPYRDSATTVWDLRRASSC
jgi:thioredoxin reductase